ncbi:response regulator receiver modulated diguanylate cyclase with PAS/PAC sensor [Pseudodesulfovibrio mercurii]|uniref:Response regulator receiver modulated diguanylate cyclase with PAS/PAC sensor n=1 Tax=Pseudodesulfovibrio mercurii TaxID=641491 RepID=F0JHK2_9BACT|nr:diguanylate cyclase [Pseudodesulfovibrio mercurii]EGB14062.1 response regulator receiver modulated diguanylate cyclase with PAS/PAC sensor [Pseudodesulfovibrio mercurii]
MTDPQKILIVDDSRTNLALLNHMLRDVECEVVQADGGLEAVELARGDDFALILMDIQMPGMNGYEAAARIKEHERSRHVPIIFITAIFQDEENVRQGYETGAVDYLFRPVDVDVLISKVKAFLEMHRQKVLLEREVEQRRRTEAALSVAEEKYRSIFERAIEGIFQCTPEGAFLEANPAMLRILGYERVEEVVGRSGFRDRFMVEENDRRHYRERMERDGAVTGFEFRLQRRDGKVVWCSESSRMIRSETGGAFIEGVLEDITERKNVELELKRLATLDSLTGVANRHRFFDRLEHALAVAKRYGTRVAVLFVDLDHFKRVNDTHGHQTGDELLRLVAGRLRQRTRESDTLARLGGDEFGILLPGIVDQEGALSFARDLLEVVRQPYEVGGLPLTIGATVGISFYPEDGRDTVTLISRADAAMYGAKKRGRSDFGTFAEYDGPE